MSLWLKTLYTQSFAIIQGTYISSVLQYSFWQGCIFGMVFSKYFPCRVDNSGEEREKEYKCQAPECGAIFKSVSTPETYFAFFGLCPHPSKLVSLLVHKCKKIIIQHARNHMNRPSEKCPQEHDAHIGGVQQRYLVSMRTFLGYLGYWVIDTPDTPRGFSC